MPKLYEYFGIIVFFYSNEHEPIHVHGKRENREGKAELVVEDGRVVEIHYSSVKGRRPLKESEFNDFRILTGHFADEIVQKWIEMLTWLTPADGSGTIRAWDGQNIQKTCESFAAGFPRTKHALST